MSEFNLRFPKKKRTESATSEASSPIEVKKRGTQTPLVPCAKDLIDAYRAHPKKLQIKVNGTLNDLNGFSIDLKDIDDLKTAAGARTLSKVFIAFGVSAKNFDATIGAPNNRSFTTILFGIDTNDTLFETTAIDFSDPCPPVCPTNTLGFQ